MDAALGGPPLAGNESPGPILAVLTMNTIAGPGAASGLDLERYVREELANLGPIGNNVMIEPATIGGAAALIARGPLGFGKSRAAYLLADDALYVLFNDPIHADQAEIQADADLIWNTVTGSLTFFDVPAVDIVTPGGTPPGNQG